MYQPPLFKCRIGEDSNGYSKQTKNYKAFASTLVLAVLAVNQLLYQKLMHTLDFTNTKRATQADTLAGELLLAAYETGTRF